MVRMSGAWHGGALVAGLAWALSPTLQVPLAPLERRSQGLAGSHPLLPTLSSPSWDIILFLCQDGHG